MVIVIKLTVETRGGSMSNRYGQVFEDPMYDEDGNLVDEDADWETEVDPGDLEYDEDIGEWVDPHSYDPFDTVNS